MSERRQSNEQQKPEQERRKIQRRRDLPKTLGEVVENSVNRIAELEAREAELQSENDRLDKEKYVDSLTGIANRRALDETLKQLVEIAHNNNEPLALGIGDLDGLKLTNDTVSPQAGDNLIKAAAEGFKQAARDTDLVGRHGGDEFFVLLPGFKPVEGVKTTELIDDMRSRFVGAVDEEIKKIGLPENIPAAISFDVLVLQPGESTEAFIERVSLASKKVKEHKYENLVAMGGIDRRAQDRRLIERPPTETAA